MKAYAREMQLSEVALVVDYFHHATPEHLETMGVDPSRMPRRVEWLESFKQDFALPVERRANFLVIWLSGEDAVGFSTCNHIIYGERANMHLHVTVPEHRRQGIGAECVRQSIDIYFDRLKLEHLFCEPNAFNVAPNRTLQKVGFKYLKTHKTVPGAMNYHQAVTRWMMERKDWSRA